MKTRYYFVVFWAIVLLKQVNINAADRTRLLARLNDKSWPWFGDCYKKSCPDSTKDLTRCFNYRPQAESVLQRAGIPSTVQLSVDLDVVFASPEEPVDVCGKAQVMKEVRAFKLDEDGHASKAMLERGSEVYRNPPKINFVPNEGTTYQIIIFDVGLLMVRGYWCDVKIVNGIIQGQAKMNYRPPANPIPVVNPILIILLRDKECFRIGVCKNRGSSRDEANDCRQTLVTRFGDGKDIEGLQVFYTNGASLFEKYMACTEGYICDSLCIDKFKEYAVNKKPSITFADLDLSHLDMYVNVFIDSEFISEISYSCSRCAFLSERRYSRTSGFRARPGDDLKISSPEKLCGDLCHNHRKIEISSTKENIMGDSSYYSFYSIVTSKESQVQIVWRKPNMRLPVSYTKYRIGEFENYKANGNSTRHMFLLLFSHTNQLNGDLSVSTSGLVDIPEVFKLRAISWLLFEHQYFTPFESDCTDPSRSCPPNEPFQLNDRTYNFTFSESAVEAIGDTKPPTYCLQNDLPIPPPPPPPPPPTHAPQQPHAPQPPTNKSVINSCSFRCVIWLLVYLMC